MTRAAWLTTFVRNLARRWANPTSELASLDGLDLVKRVLEEAGAPKGSELRGGESQVVPFGVTERVTLWLDGTTLPDDVYERFSTNDLGDQIEAAMAFDASAEIRGSWQGPSETCQNARVIVRDGNPALGPREMRLPMLPSEPAEG